MWVYVACCARKSDMAGICVTDKSLNYQDFARTDGFLLILINKRVSATEYMLRDATPPANMQVSVDPGGMSDSVKEQNVLAR